VDGVCVCLCIVQTKEERKKREDRALEIFEGLETSLGGRLLMGRVKLKLMRDAQSK
jgi:hypothetical protein